jgi:hypothetical protein
MIDIRTRTADLLGKTGFEPEQFWLGVFIFVVVVVSIGTAVSLGNILRFEDERQYMSIARNLVDVGAYSINGNTPTAYRPPSWPLLLAVGNLISYNVIWLRLINLVLHLGTSLLLLRFVRRLGLPFAAALITSAAYLFFPVLYFTATTFYPQTLCAFLIALMLNIMLACGVWATAVLGILTSVTALAAPGTALVLCLLVFLQTYHLPMRAMLLRLAVFGVAAALALTPWIARNYMAFAAFIPLSTSAGENLLKGNLPGAGADTGAAQVDIDFYLKKVSGLPEPEADKKMGGFALEWILSNKREAAMLYLGKFLNWFNYRNNLGTKGQVTAIGSIVAFLSYYSALIAAVVGSSMWRRSVEPMSRPLNFWLWLFYIAAGLTYAITFTRVRFRVPFEIILFILATPFVARLTNWFDAVGNSTKTKVIPFLADHDR